MAGVALNAVPDPFANSPLFCGTFAQCFLVTPAATEAHAFRWTEAGGMQDLGALGGPDSAASFVNQRGQVAGEFFTSFTPNPSTGVPTLDPFFWENGKMVDIGSLGGTLGIPYWMNNRGQVVGFSNVAEDQSNHAFLWDRHHNPPLTDLGTLGGTYSSATWINDAGEIVGDSNLAGDQTGRAFLWKNGVMTNLRTVAGDPCSGANSINSQGQIVGFGSADCNNEDHAALSENGGPLVDLQTLVLPGSGVTLTNAVFINDQGEIAARGVLSNGDQRAVVLIPCDEKHPGVEGCDYSLVDSATLPPSAAPAVQHPAAGNRRSRMPAGMWNRFRSRGGQQTLGSATNRAPAAEHASPVSTDGVDVEGGQLLAPLFGRYKGYCGVYGGTLTGYCTAYSYYSCLAKVSTACPSGKAATKPGYFQCSNRFSRYVDLARGCGFN